MKEEEYEKGNYVYCDMRGNVFDKLGFEDNENVNLDNVKFEKYYPNNKNL